MEFLKLQQRQNAEFWAAYRQELMADYLRALQPETIAEVEAIEDVIDEEVAAMQEEDFSFDDFLAELFEENREPEEEQVSTDGG